MGNPRYDRLGLSISYSWNPTEQLGNVFIFGPLNINKWSFLGTSKGDFCRSLLVQQIDNWRQCIPTQKNPQGNMGITRPSNREQDRPYLYKSEIQEIDAKCKSTQRGRYSLRSPPSADKTEVETEEQS